MKVTTTQLCTTCTEEKSLHEFSLRSTVTGQRHRICRACHAKVRKIHYGNNKQAYLSNVKKWNGANVSKRKLIALASAKKTARQTKQRAVEYKGNCCSDCGGVFPLCCYDFHHLDPKGKDMHLAKALSARGFEYCKAELDKCVLLCSNCHRIRHYDK